VKFIKILQKKSDYVIVVIVTVMQKEVFKIYIVLEIIRRIDTCHILFICFNYLYKIIYFF